MALARYGYSVGCAISCGGAGVLLGFMGCAEALGAPAGPPGYPETGEDVSKPFNWAEVYIWGGCVEAVVCGRS